MTVPAHSIRLILSCPDRVGIVAGISSFLAAEGGLITEANHYRDPESEWFFARQVISAASLPYGIDELRRRFAPVAAEFALNWQAVATATPKRVVVMVSRQAHCLIIFCT